MSVAAVCVKIRRLLEFDLCKWFNIDVSGVSMPGSLLRIFYITYNVTF